MIIDNKYNPTLATSTDEARHILSGVFITESTDEPGNARAVATDGVVMAVTPCMLSDGEIPGRIIPGAMLAKAAKASRKSGICHVDISGEKPRIKEPSGTTEGEFVEGTFPNWKQAIPTTPTAKLSISLDAEKLLRLAKAIGAEKDKKCVVTLSFFEGHDSIKVTTQNSDGWGLLSPCRK